MNPYVTAIQVFLANELKRRCVMAIPGQKWTKAASLQPIFNQRQAGNYPRQKLVADRERQGVSHRLCCTAFRSQGRA
jgi:hypothetical protein